MAKQKRFVVTKFYFEEGLELRNQYVISARSEKEAMELTLHNEKIVIQEVEESKVPERGDAPEKPEQEAKPTKK